MWERLKLSYSSHCQTIKSLAAGCEGCNCDKCVCNYFGIKFSPPAMSSKVGDRAWPQSAVAEEIRSHSGGIYKQNTETVRCLQFKTVAFKSIS